MGEGDVVWTSDVCEKPNSILLKFVEHGFVMTGGGDNKIMEL